MIDKRMLEILGAVASIGGALVALHGVTNKRWQLARAVFVVGGATLAAVVRYTDDDIRIARDSKS